MPCKEYGEEEKDQSGRLSTLGVKNSKKEQTNVGNISR
jgi:hypothetical protein